MHKCLHAWSALHCNAFPFCPRLLPRMHCIFICAHNFASHQTCTVRPHPSMLRDLCVRAMPVSRRPMPTLSCTQRIVTPAAPRPATALLCATLLCTRQPCGHFHQVPPLYHALQVGTSRQQPLSQLARAPALKVYPPAGRHSWHCSCMASVGGASVMREWPQVAVAFWLRCDSTRAPLLVAMPACPDSSCGCSTPARPPAHPRPWYPPWTVLDSSQWGCPPPVDVEKATAVVLPPALLVCVQVCSPSARALPCPCEPCWRPVSAMSTCSQVATRLVRLSAVKLQQQEVPRVEASRSCMNPLDSELDPLQKPTGMVGSAHPTSKSNGCKMSSASLLLRAGRRLLGLGGAPRDAAAWGPLAAGGARQVRRGGHWNRAGWCGCLSTNAWAHQQAPTPRPAPPACPVQGQQQPGGDQGRGAGQRQSAHVHATGRPRRVPQASGALQCRVRRECALSVLAAGPRRLLLCCARTDTAARAAAPVLVCGLEGQPPALWRACTAGLLTCTWVSSGRGWRAG